MSFDNFPGKTFTTATVSGSQLNLDINFEGQSVPPNIHQALTEKLGWAQWGTCPDTNQPIYRKNNSSLHYFYWYEAMAYEFYRFMNIGED